MSIVGIGIDIVELARMKRLLEKDDRFIKRVFTDWEQARLSQLQGKRKIEYAGGRFAAKEAFVKATGTGISKEYGFQDIEVRAYDSGKPYLIAPNHHWVVHLSITHSDTYALAQVILESR
ncbi:holo-ACP synthase [Aliibacillus thermotolerans]|uniref:Holo-[acyl-carrier-protein] synthase n=1 Tax=Aliibacillus thermotolerans TaxID=1834418 RepID=A0ABW0U8J8_9BACI|nr:holo-ACP synthase [Aliibacillus thermotolerans]MDA3129577.1 holo-ACP synthase [Aliibacillus thermotolerans]